VRPGKARIARDRRVDQVKHIVEIGGSLAVA
jgi:hypothetical protein